MVASTDLLPHAWVGRANAALLTDLYELTMAAAFHAEGIDDVAVYELFVRRLPERRNFLVACGLEQALDFLSSMRFDDDSIAYLRSLGMFEETFLERLRHLRFTGDVWAVPEGEVVFSGEPLLTVVAPMVEAQVVETFLLTTVLFQTMVASKAARVALACGTDSTFVDFSARRDHGPDAALKAARAAFVGGAEATSNVLAGRLFELPLSGTMAHAYVMAFDHELDAFRTFARRFPDHAVLLIDTYDTLEGARRAVRVASELEADGIRLKGLRLDSGDLDALSREVRRTLDDAGMTAVRIVASGDLDEYRIGDLRAAHAPIDAFGVGTRLGTSADEPSLGGVYKLVEDARGPKMKRSEGKVTLPGRKQVHRVTDDSGTVSRDILALDGEPVTDGRPLLVRVMAEGEVVHREPLSVARERARAAVAALPDDVRRIDAKSEVPVVHSPGLDALVVRLQGGDGE